MNILGISGSPRPEGNTSFAVQHALTLLKREGFSTRYISLSNKKITPCISCWKCSETHTCIFDDDMTEILDAMNVCQGLIIGSPVFFGMVSGQLKIMMDRCVVMRPNYGDPLPMSGKLGGAIACAYSRNGGQEMTIQNIHTFFLQMNLRVIGDGPGFVHTGATIVGEAKEDTWGMKTVENLAQNLADMLRKS
jgi:multimeric flavodoxin WrbA